MTEEAERDRRLVARLADGDRAALGELYDRHAAPMLGLAFRILKNRRDAEDLLHDVLLEAWHRARDYDPARASVRTWLLLRVRSRAIDRARALATARERALPDPAAAPPPLVPEPGLAADHARARRALESLPKEQRSAIELAYFEGLSCREMAERSGFRWEPSSRGSSRRWRSCAPSSARMGERNDVRTRAQAHGVRPRSARRGGAARARARARGVARGARGARAGAPRPRGAGARRGSAPPGAGPARDRAARARPAQPLRRFRRARRGPARPRAGAGPRALLPDRSRGGGALGGRRRGGRATAPLRGGPRVAGADCGIVSVEPGRVYPRHLHRGEELAFVLQGRAEEDTGRVWEPGDLVCNPAGSVHSFRASGPEPFAFVVVLHEGLEFVRD